MIEKQYSNATLKCCDMFSDDGFKSIPDNSVDAIITDFPYGVLNTQKNLWDKVIDYDLFWEEAYRVCKLTAPIISTASMPFTAYLISTNYKDFKYTLVWEKSKASGYMNAKKQPLRAHEDIVVFYRKQCTYNPQMVQGEPYHRGYPNRDTDAYDQNKTTLVESKDGLRYPRSVLYFTTAEREGKYHVSQKPIKLMEYLVKTYTNEGCTILDCCMGSGTTGISCINTNRKFIGFEMEEKFFSNAVKRFDKNIINFS